MDNTVRETKDYHPPPSGDYDGATRAATLKALLEKHDEEHELTEAPRRRVTFFTRFGFTR